MSTKTEQNNLVRTIRLNDQQVEAVLDVLDRTDPVKVTRSRRASDRFSYRVRGCVIHLKQLGDSKANAYLVATRNISRNGLSFLHGTFVHRGSECFVQLITMHGAWQDVEGKVAHCRYVEAGLHEVGVHFVKPIEPAEFCSAAISSKVLLAEDDASTAALIRYHLKSLNAEVDHVTDGQAAIDRALTGGYTLVLLDMGLPTVDGFDVARQLRERGFSGGIVAVTGHTHPEEIERCLTSGCDMHLPKPIDREGLSKALASQQGELLFSTMSGGDPEFDKLIADFLKNLPTWLRQANEAFAASDWPTLAELARTLKGHAGSYGFAPITQEAADFEEMLMNEPSAEDAGKRLRDLEQLCLRARSTGNAQLADDDTEATAGAEGGGEGEDEKTTEAAPAK